jgi:hypothetical protein
MDFLHSPSKQISYPSSPSIEYVEEDCQKNSNDSCCKKTIICWQRIKEYFAFCCCPQNRDSAEDSFITFNTEG